MSKIDGRLYVRKSLLTTLTLASFLGAGCGGSGSGPTALPSSNAELSALVLSGGAISPAFDRATVAYSVSVPYTVTLADNSATFTIDGDPGNSGVPSSNIPLSVGVNPIEIVVVAHDGTTTKTYAVAVTRAAPHAIADLSGLVLSAGAISPAFVPTTTSYTLSVGQDTVSTNVTATLSDNAASFTVEGVAGTSGLASAELPLAVGPNTITILVTAQDGTATKTYSVTVFRAAPHANADLSALVLSAGAISPAFNASTTSYNLSVPNGVTSTTVTATLADNTATFVVNTIAGTNGAASAGIDLAVGSNTITVLVTAQDGTTTKSYAVTVTRAALGANADLSDLVLSAGAFTPSFVLSTTTYNLSVATNFTSTTVTATLADSTASFKVNNLSGTNAAASGDIPLVVGGNTITVLVTAQDGTTTKSYSVTVNRAAPSANADLSGLELSAGPISPAFNASTTTYNLSVANDVTGTTVTATLADNTASLAVNDSAGASATASANIPLNVGANTITVLVTAQDGTTTKSYTVTVTRAALSANADLSDLVLSAGPIVPTFNSSQAVYTLSVANSVATTTVTATLADSTASFSVNSTVGVSGVATGDLSLAVGANTITVLVTAQNGTSTKSYTVTVTRAASSNADLGALSLSAGVFTTPFIPGITAYSSAVGGRIVSTTVTATLADAAASFTVNGAVGTSGIASASIPLLLGSNSLSIVVTAQDGITIKTYTVTVIRGSLAAEGTFASPADTTGALPRLSMVDTTLSYYVATVTPGVTYQISLTALTDNVDLYVFDGDNTFTTAVCASTQSGLADELCPVTATGTQMYIMVDGQLTAAGATFTLDVVAGPPMPPAQGSVIAPVDVTGLLPFNGTVDLSNSFYVATVVFGTTYTITLTNLTNDADLLVYNSDSTFSSFPCFSVNVGTVSESCTVVADGSLMYIDVSGAATQYSGGGAHFTLDVF